ncbi:C40 family peptidase [Bombilactobacillus bombi]|uniref:C40 family peptidase n=1 Tax=Bombilactobacillus bombi TaxID=1303590 RepID=UPI00359CB799
MKAKTLKASLAAGSITVSLLSLFVVPTKAQTIVVSHQENPEIAVANQTPKLVNPIQVNTDLLHPQVQAQPIAPAPVTSTAVTITFPQIDDLDQATADFSANGLTQMAQKYLGVPYVWGGTTPQGFDCSGLVQYVALANGLSLPRTSQQQSECGTYIPLSQIQPGDLLFWGEVGAAEHVAIYLGNGQYIHAPQPGQNVKIGRLQWFTPTFGRRLNIDNGVK